MTSVGAIIYPGFELLDLAGPLDVLARAPDIRAITIARSRELVEPDLAPSVRPDTTFEEAPHLDIVFVPGGHGISQAIGDDATLQFLRRRSEAASYVTSVCTGALLLGAAGLLEGYRATTHWRYLELLRIFGAEPVAARTVEDRNRITGAGVTAGLDFGFALVARIRGSEVAKRLQLGLEYDPAPPFLSGHPAKADPEIVEAYERDTAARYTERERVCKEAVARRSR